WQKNCLGSEQTKDGAYATRLDDINPWIQNTINQGRKITGLDNNAFIELKEFNTNSVCVTVKDRSGTAGASTQTEQCGDPASKAGKDAWLAKKWELVETAPNSNIFALRNFISDKCLVAGGEGQPMGQQDCQLSNASNQWQFFAVENNQLQVRSVANGLFLTNNGDKQAVTVAKNTAGLKQRWAFNAVGKALYNIAPANTYVSIENPGTPGRVIRHADWLGWSHLVNGNSPLQTRQDATWKIIPGLANDRCYSFESINFPGNYLYSGGSSARTGLAAIAGKDTKDFTWCAEEAKAGNQTITFAKYSDRFRVLRMNGNELYQGALFPAGIPKADDEYRITEDTAWKLRDPLATPAP
ncbi:MAG: AbfB domain-containing protein, partial [Renibacterium sp.]|nr:AbfB domain-containing protein [Renibacterium sp.]